MDLIWGDNEKPPSFNKLKKKKKRKEKQKHASIKMLNSGNILFQHRNPHSSPMEQPNTAGTNESTSHTVEIAMETEVHRVEPPPRLSTFQKLKARLKETFFPDDPFRQFKGQPCKTKSLLAAQYIFPILEWGPKYNLKLLKSDVVSGLTIASLAIPQVCQKEIR